MRSKRLLTMLLAVVMILSVMSPAVSAVKPGEVTVMHPAAKDESAASKTEASAFDNSLVFSPDSANQGLSNLRDNPKLGAYVQEAEAEQGEGSRVTTKVDKDLNLTVSEVPESVQELKEAAEYFEKNEKVVAFVVMEQAPLAEQYSSITKVAPTTASSMLAVQNKVIDEIETDVLNGSELEVRYQFTYMTNSFSIASAENGQVLHQETITNNPKTMYISAYGQVVPWIYSWYGYDMYDFEGLENGTEVILTIDATVTYGLGGDHSIQIPITIDTGAVAAVFVMNLSGTQTYTQAYDVQMVPEADGSMTAYVDITGMGTEFLIAVCDYAGNESYYEVRYTSAGENLPEMDTDLLYAYRVFDEYIFGDHMYGWVSMKKPASADEVAFVSAWTDDYLEYAAINAAEYVDGKIFAVDAVYNLLVMDPGLFNRNTVRNLGVNVVDMTFDDSTDTMYVLSKQDYDIVLYTMDLLTGELTEAYYYGYCYDEVPYAIADNDNGTLYALAYNSSSVYTVDVAGENYEMTPVTVTDDEGNETVLTVLDSEGSDVRPNYAQGLTWADGKLYWAYFYTMYDYYYLSADLITIDTETWEQFASPYEAQAYDASNTLVTYRPHAELVGLLTLSETDYTFPASPLMLRVRQPSP